MSRVIQPIGRTIYVEVICQANVPTCLPALVLEGVLDAVLLLPLKKLQLPLPRSRHHRDMLPFSTDRIAGVVAP